MAFDGKKEAERRFGIWFYKRAYEWRWSFTHLLRISGYVTLVKYFKNTFLYTTSFESSDLAR